VKTVGRPYLFLLLAFGVAALFVRFWRLGETPLWYSDECDFIGLAAELGDGVALSQARHKALIFPFATNAMPHPPLYFYASGALIHVFGKTVLCGRALSAVLGVLGTVLLYGAVRTLWGRLAALTAAGLFAFHLPSVLLQRWGMPYNLAMAFLIAAFWAMARGGRGARRDLWNAAAVVLGGGAAVSSFFGLAAAGMVWLIGAWRLRRRPWLLAGALALACVPFAGFLAVGHLARGASFWSDFIGLGARASGGGGVLDSAGGLAFQLGRLATRDAAYALGAAGLVWIALRDRGRRWTTLFFLAAALPVLLKRGLDPQFKYDSVNFLFLLYAGAGAAVAHVRRGLHRLTRRRADWRPGDHRRIEAIAIASAILVFAALAGFRIQQVCDRLPSRFEKIGSVLSPADALRLADWINERADDEDLIVAPDRVHFLLRGRITSLYQATAYTYGSTTWHENIEPERFAYPCDVRQARFVILDNTDALVLSPANPNMDRMFAELNSDRWRPTCEIGEYQILEPQGR
jgi:4-amino-4-deoxy-L-arabinose transferase-like glycosyltransferase